MSQRPAVPTVLVNLLLEPPDVITGITRYSFFLLEQIVRRGQFRVALATTWTREKLPETLRSDAVDVHVLPFVQSQPLNILSQMRVLPGLMRTSGAVLEFNPSSIGAFGGGWPRVATVHDLYFKTMPQFYLRRHRLWWDVFFPQMVRSATQFVCISDATRRDLINFYPQAANKSTTVHSASGLVATNPPSVERDPFFGLFVCNIAPNKGTHTLVEAMDLLARRGRPVDIRHVGKDAGGAIARAQGELGTTAGPAPLGPISDDALMALYETASFLAFPSIGEGFGLPVIEAQTFGVPAIASDIPVLREVAGEGALFFPVGDANALAERIDALAHDPASQRILARAALDNAARFSWDRAAGEVEAIFARALGRDQRGRGQGQGGEDGR